MNEKTNVSSEVGTVISTLDTPNSEKFHFVIKKRVNKGQFVEFETEEGRVIARVAEVRKTNRYFMEAESVSEYEKSGISLDHIFPTHEWEYLVGEGLCLGVYTTLNGKELVKRPSFPPSPGSKVYLADKSRLARFLGLDMAHGLDIGELQFQGIKAKLNLTKLLQKHLAILAQSGAGKSYLAAVILEELMDRKKEDGQVAVVVIDPHGEYAGFAKDKQYVSKVKVYNEKDIQIGMPSLSVHILEHIFPDMSSAQKRELYKIVNSLRKEMKSGKGVFGLKEFEEAVLDAKIKSNVKEVIVDLIQRMKTMHLFRRYDNPSLNDIQQGKMIVFDLSNIIDMNKKQIIVSFFASKLFHARRMKLIPPYFFLVEEAHNFAPEKVKLSSAISKRIITQIAREGRKFHASLGLISQRPINLATTALAQCNTHFILRVTNPYDLDHIGKSSEGITQDVRNSIPGLRVGECIVVGEAVKYPIFIMVRERKSEEFETGKLLEEAALEFSKNQSQENKDVEAFI